MKKTGRQRELGRFLRTKREALEPRPEKVFGTSRRRTPGLRREEVAEHSRVSATWYTWLEQGRAISVSPEALRRIARALELKASETAYLFKLAGVARPKARRLETPSVPESLSRLVQRLADPAVVLSDQLVPLVWNELLSGLIVDLDAHAGARRSWMEIMFLDAHVRQRLRNWEAHARRFVAEFREVIGGSVEDPWVEKAVARLGAESEEFARLWQAYELADARGALVFEVAIAGRPTVAFERSILFALEAPRLRLMVFTKIG